ncbi:hypothetical protein ACFFRR_007464 [Megaselia abdita]
MKVDKAVSTNGTLEDLAESLRYRELFTTLVRNKILLNKKIYEECKMAKKKRKQAIIRYFFIRKSFCSRKCHKSSSPPSSSIETVIELKKSRFSPMRGFRRRFMNFRSGKHKVTKSVADTVGKVDDGNIAETRLEADYNHHQTIQSPNELRVNTNNGSNSSNVNNNNNNSNNNNISVDLISTSTNQKPCDQISSNLESKVSSLSSTSILHHDNLTSTVFGQDTNSQLSPPIATHLTRTTFLIKNEKIGGGGGGGSAESMPYIFKNTNQLNILKHKATSISAECSPILLRHHQLQQEQQFQAQQQSQSESISNSMQLHALDDVENVVPIFVESQVKQSSPSILKKHKQSLQQDIVRYNSSSSSSENSVTIMKFNNARKSNYLVDNLGVLPSWPSDGYDPQAAIEKKLKKYRNTGSDPGIVYDHINDIISIPHNPSPLPYVYDMTLEVDASKNELKTLVEKSHKHRHHHNHHHHHRRKKRKHKKILVHDLETQRIREIDPDDLSQKARWTIIATACLLLLMCLMLVGITLRMAPIIDEMVRQENERLMQETMKIPKNFTDASAFYARHSGII